MLFFTSDLHFGHSNIIRAKRTEGQSLDGLWLELLFQNPIPHLQLLQQAEESVWVSSKRGRQV